jgi:hypothetical protein
MEGYQICEPPESVEAGPESRLSGFYRGRFIAPDGERLVRFMTDKGRAGVLRMIDDGLTELTADEFETWTVAPDMSDLEARTVAESGEGG